MMEELVLEPNSQRTPDREIFPSPITRLKFYRKLAGVALKNNFADLAEFFKWRAPSPEEAEARRAERMMNASQELSQWALDRCAPQFKENFELYSGPQAEPAASRI